MFSIIIGICLAIGFVGLYNRAKSKNLKISWWQWAVTIIWLLCTGFVLKLIEGFIIEGALRAALVMGGIFGFLSIVAAVLLFRFVFFKSLSHE